MKTIKNWRQRMHEYKEGMFRLKPDVQFFADQEIADLRAALTSQAESAPVDAVTELPSWDKCVDMAMLEDFRQRALKAEAALAQRAASKDSERDAALHLIGWREWDGRWVFHDAQEDPELCAHIAEYQKESHGVSVWPVYCAAMAAQHKQS